MFQNDSEIYHYYEEYAQYLNQSQLKSQLVDLAKNRVSETNEISVTSEDAQEESTSKQEETSLVGMTETEMESSCIQEGMNPEEDVASVDLAKNREAN